MFQVRLWLNGKWQTNKEMRDIKSPFHNEVVSQCHYADEKQLDEAIKGAAEAFSTFRLLSRFTRSRLLHLMAEGIRSRKDEIIERMVLEGGKPRQLSSSEVERAIVTFTYAAEEVKRWGGEIIPVDIEPNGTAYSPAISLYVPRGPILAIAPFNFPLNLIAHKVAPALAAGNSIIVKPPPQDPGAAAILAEIFEKAANEINSSSANEKIPLATLQVFAAANPVIERAVTSPSLTTLSFTGSEKVGWLLQQKSVGKKVVLELGGNAGVIVHKDADLKRAAARCAYGAYAYAGQICISVQRILVHKDVRSEFERLLLNEISALKVGDPNDPTVTVGPLIDSLSADRIQNWTKEAVDGGARILCGGERSRNIVTPMLITNAPTNSKIRCEEIFGPVATIDSYSDFSAALVAINDSKFGLQAGVFTDSSHLIQQAFRELEVGGIMINEVPTYRADNMPYGGIKQSGLGREGIRYAMEHFSEVRTMVSWLG